MNEQKPVEADSNKNFFSQVQEIMNSAKSPPDEMRVILLKAQNAQLTKSNSSLSDMVQRQQKVVAETESVLL